MRRVLAWIGIVLAVAGFIMLALVFWLNIHFMIPVGMIIAAGLILLAAKKMPSDDAGKKDDGEGKSDE